MVTQYDIHLVHAIEEEISKWGALILLKCTIVHVFVSVVLAAWILSTRMYGSEQQHKNGFPFLCSHSSERNRSA